MSRFLRSAVFTVVFAGSASFLIAHVTAAIDGGQQPAAPAPQSTGAPAPPAPPEQAAPFGFRSTSELTDFTPKAPYTARTPAEEAKGFMLPAGYRLELVAADPDVISPTLIEFDGNGRMYVGEM